MIHLYSGDGKGKTTASVGLAVRAAGADKKVIFAQFLKGSESSELNILNILPNITIFRLDKNYGFYNSMSEDTKEEVKRQHTEILKNIHSRIMDKSVDVIILDEITYVDALNILNDKELLFDILYMSKYEDIEVIMTGNQPTVELENISNYYTEMKKIQHPFDKGIQARKGIEF